ncbi:NAD(+) diphosphatase [Mesorhizobium sp. M2A.F.Ca.ET.037.01.1.1]|uniref:NAD(+) diphosphatase n=1 Tax=Mesorhizobium sp. M2A.F.Ca.ET.037.01.1.1 TaxID=2496748 RepID=UPI00247AF94B|nr:NAD(+) diphosphatase [Mesorhizobium sp. M2A.F.Ca.ET.037.01.1.1]
MLDQAIEALAVSRRAMAEQGIHLALAAIFGVVAEADRYFASQEPWALKKTNPERMETVLWTTAELVRRVALLCQPFIPGSAAKLLDLLAVPAGIEPENLPETVKAIDYRSVYMQGLIDEAAAGALAQGAALLAWHASHAFCSKCGNRSEMRAGGYRRHCPACGTDHFPRTDPVAIMLTATREKCLLGRGRHFAPGMYSALAGFIEPGETIEAAVRRETLEEAGIRLGRVVYHASQPWPFPYSLMIGCFGEPLNEDIQADLNELEDCRWFFRAEVRTMLDRTHADGLITPPKGAIAHHLIRAWVDSE